jgi:hypothetical protein
MIKSSQSTLMPTLQHIHDVRMHESSAAGIFPMRPVRSK